MNNKINSYKDLIVWQKSIALVTEIYKLTKAFPAEEKFGIVNQLNRAVVSIPANIAEGWGRESSKNYLQFLRVSRGSLMETETLLVISKNLNYIDDENFRMISEKLDETGKILQGLIKGVQQKINLTESA
ncbi:MAG: four helix bundle protein [Bacteroidetes bacterium]|nr:four helix bundle protein [Bacteroidota bacterium]